MGEASGAHEKVRASKLKKPEKAYLQLALEEHYISKLFSYNFLMSLSRCDSVQKAAAKGQFTAVDPHAASLLFPTTLSSAFLFNTGHLKYLESNGLDQLPFDCYLKERKRAENLFTNEDHRRMNILGYTGSIPHYLIYNKEGKLVKTLSGWSGLEAMIAELDAVVGDK